MELRVLKYFLVVAREENITKAASLLPVTQPTLSRQLMQLEELSGEISIGAGESNSMTALSQTMTAFRREHSLVRFSIYSATADDIKDRLEKGLLDLGLLAEPVDIGRYEFIRMPKRDRWGVWIRYDDPLAQKEAVGPGDLAGVPLLVSRRELVQKELAAWFGDSYEKLEIAATYNLILNAANMVRNHMGAALGFFMGNLADELRFVPLEPPLETGTVLVWKKDQAFSQAATAFLNQIKNAD